jgi:uncharacterized protein YdgA (DUF945 family)
MKKSLVAVSVIVILGAAWTGAAWYTGKQFEQRMGEMVANANSQIQTYLPKAGIKLVYQDYQRNIFSSKVRYVLQADPAAQGEKALKEGDEIAFIETIDHGPFPFAQLKKFNLIPSMASVHSELENTPAVKGLFEVTKGKSLINADSRISYSGDTSSTVNIIPVDFQKNASKLQFGGATFDIDIAKDLSKVSFDGSSNSLIVTSQNQWGQLEKVTLSDLSMSSNTSKGKFQLGMGDQKITAKQIAINVDGKDSAVLEGFTLNSTFGEDDKNIHGQFDYTLDALKIQGNDFGSGKLSIKLDRIDGEALKQFSNVYNQQAMQLLQQGEQIDPAVYQQQMADILVQNLPLLLKGGPVISVNPLSWKNAKGESSFTLQVDLNAPQPNQAPAQTEDQLISQWLKKVDATLIIPVPMATEVATQTGKLQGYSAEEAQKLAEQQVQGLAAMGQMFKLTTLKDDAIRSSFHYADNQVELNGQKMTLQEFAGLFGMLGAPSAPEEVQPDEPDSAPTPSAQ